MVKNSNSFETEIIMLFMSGPQKAKFGAKMRQKVFFYENNLFFGKKGSPTWNKCNRYQLNLRISNALHLQYSDTSKSEVFKARDGKFSSQWSLRKKLIPAEAAFHNKEKSINKSPWNECKFLKVCKTWALENGLCIVQIAACFFYFSYYIGKKMGKNHNSIISELNYSLFYFFSNLIYMEAFKNNYKDSGLPFPDYLDWKLGYANSKERDQDKKEFAFFFVKTFEDLGFIVKSPLEHKNYKNSHDLNLGRSNNISTNYKINNNWHNLGDIVIVKLINDPELFNPNFYSNLVLDFEKELSVYLNFCNSRKEWLKHDTFSSYMEDDCIYEKNLEQYEESERLVSEYMDLAIFHNVYKVSNYGYAYLVKGIEYDNYYFNIAKSKRGRKRGN